MNPLRLVRPAALNLRTCTLTLLALNAPPVVAQGLRATPATQPPATPAPLTTQGTSAGQGFNLVTNLNVTGAGWTGYFVMPTALIVNQLAPNDEGCGRKASGLLHDNNVPMPGGTYVVEFQGRTVRDTLNVTYGLNDLASATASLTPQWQTFRTTLDWRSKDPRLQDPKNAYNAVRAFQMFEATANNPAWEVRAMSLRRKKADGTFSQNLLNADDASEAYWQGYCTKPKVQTSVIFLARDAAPDNSRSGVIRHLKKGSSLPPGVYRVTLEARALSAPLEIRYGMNDHLTAKAQLTPNWQTLTQEFTLPVMPASQYDANRIFQVFENTPVNSVWEIRNVSVERLR